MLHERCIFLAISRKSEAVESKLFECVCTWLAFACVGLLVGVCYHTSNVLEWLDLHDMKYNKMAVAKPTSNGPFLLWAVDPFSR